MFNKGGRKKIKVRTRFAPSPTGPIHIGGIRTALYNYALARKNNGEFIVRIEDTDIKRSKKEYEDDILDSLNWLGMVPDESPRKGGKFGPYRQSERKDIYKKKLERLKEKEFVYPCFCTESELKQMKKKQLQKGEKPGYDGRCYGLDKKEVEKKLKSGAACTWRFHLRDRKVKFNDLIKGEIEIELSALSDFVVLKSDGFPSYHFAVVADDIDMKITHVLRGEDHLTNTAYHIALSEALEKEPPVYAHFPLIFDITGRKLSKRDKNTAIFNLRKKGILREAIIEYVSTVGYSHKNLIKPGLKEFVNKFEVKNISKSRTVFDLSKLNSMNRKQIISMSSVKLLKRMQQERFIEKAPEDSRVIKWVELWKENADNLSELFEALEVFYKDKGIWPRISFVKPLKKEITVINDYFTVYNGEINWIDNLIEFGEEKGFSRGKILKALRIVITGRTKGPSLYELIRVLGAEKVKIRTKNLIREAGWE